MYTTISRVREFSAFTDPTKVSAATIRGKISMADNLINGAAGARYALPLPYHRQCTLTFSGTGTGTGTMAIVVNGTTYNVAVTLGLTAMAAANLFRQAAVASNDFYVDVEASESADTIVTIISRSDSENLTTADAEVTISSAPTTNGISAAIGTRSDRYPPYITQLSTEIATALLYMDNYGAEAEDTPKDGVARMEKLDKMLAQIQGTDDKSKVVIKLYDEVTGEELPANSGSLPSGYPDDAAVSDGDADANVGIKDKF